MVLDEAAKKKIVFLVVDDDGQVRHILTEYLKSFGFENIVQAKDGMAALKIVQNHQQPIDFIISDWEMPHVDGLTLLKAVRNDETRQNVRFIMVSSQNSRERMKISKAAKSRVDAYVVKPFRANILQEKIKTLLNGEIDPSVKEFEGILAEVPSNLPKEDPKPNPPPLPVEKEKKSPGFILTGLKKLAKGPQKFMSRKDDKVKTGKVIVKPERQVPLGTVRAKDVESDPDLPPTDYDLENMNITLILNLAKSYQKVKWFDKAIRLCTDAHFLYPANPDLLFHLAKSYHAIGDVEATLFNLKKTIKLDPYHTEAQTFLADLNQVRKIG